MAQTTVTTAGAQPVPGPAGTQKFGRIEAVRPGSRGTEIDIRQPDGGLLVAILHPVSVETGHREISPGRNIWVSGHFDGDGLVVQTFAAYAEEL